MRKLLATTAVLEAGAGLGILAAPSAVVSLMLGSSLDIAVRILEVRHEMRRFIDSLKSQ
jgi:hypothetical protein